MRIGFVVNDVATEQKGYTTTRLSMAAVNQGHEVWVMGVGDLLYDPSDTVCANARSVSRNARWKPSSTKITFRRNGKNSRR